MRICLILEGSYPYVHGGVSTWMHHLIQQMPQHEFILWVIGAHEADRGKYVYEIPENVKEIHEVFLDTALKPGKAEKNLKLNETQKKALAELIRCGRPDWKVLLDLFQSGIRPESVLMGKDYLDILQDICRNEEPYVPFAEAFHTTRSMLLPVMYLLGQPIPEADLYHTICTGYGGLLAVMGHLQYNKPMELTEHGIYSREREEEIIRADWVRPSFKKNWIRFFYMLSSAAYDNAQWITSLFDNARKTQIDLGADPSICEVIPNGIDYDRFAAVKPKQENGWIDIGAVIRLAPIKDVKTMIYSFYGLCQKRNNVRLHILGGVDDEEYAAECYRMKEDLHLDHLKFAGLQDTAVYMEKLDFTILTSISEGQPLSVLESFAAARPAVTTDVGCCRQLIEGGKGDFFGPAGYCVPPMNREKLTNAMEELCSHPERIRVFGKNGRQRTRTYYQQDKMVAAYEAVYQKLCIRR